MKEESIGFRERGKMLEEEIINEIFYNTRLEISTKDSIEYPENFEDLSKIENSYSEGDKEGKIFYNLKYGNRKLKLTRSVGENIFGVYVSDIDVGNEGYRKNKENQTTLLFKTVKKILEEYSSSNDKDPLLLLETQHKSLKDWAVFVGNKIFKWENENGESDHKKGNWLVFRGKV